IQSLLRGASRNDAVIYFLAALELVRRRRASASQETPFGEINLQPVETDVEARSRAG
ncbi:MAG: hypothetical protein JOZ41_16515, partial [Chloroflexi bacterium]|nr:hypothetical protein [Chloroflexota bacterium]